MSAVPIPEIVNKSLGELESAQVKRLLEQGVKIPPQPRVLEELRKLLDRREFDVRKLSRVISKDPGIVSMLFKVVGSVAYQQHQPFESVEQILHAVGVRQTFNLVQAICVHSMSGKSTNRAVLEAYWARSQAIAQISMLIAHERVTVCNIFPDQAYLAGIFYDCGVPVLMERFQLYCQEMKLGDPNRWIDLKQEDATFNADHCVIGYLVARHWNLPDFICDAIRYHHDIEAVGLNAARSMVAILQLAMSIYYREQRIQNPEWSINRPDVLAELGIREDGLAEFVDDILEQYQLQAADS